MFVCSKKEKSTCCKFSSFTVKVCFTVEVGSNDTKHQKYLDNNL